LYFTSVSASRKLDDAAVPSGPEPAAGSGCRVGATATLGSVLLGYLAGQYTDAWRVVLWTVAALCVLSGLVIHRLVGDTARSAARAAVAALSDER
jgi:hypothetical protein